MDVVIIDYGAGNVQSVKYALNRLGVQPTLSFDPETIQKADKVIFPGVGAAGAAMQALQKSGLDKVIPNLQQDVLGICVGMQVMCKHSEEDDTQCLGIIDAEVKKFKSELKIPHMGWNHIENLKSPLFEDFSSSNQVYYVHSYYVELNPNTIAETDYGVRYSAAIQKDNFYAVQFHTEKSGNPGEELLDKFLKL